MNLSQFLEFAQAMKAAGFRGRITTPEGFEWRTLDPPLFARFAIPREWKLKDNDSG